MCERLQNYLLLEHIQTELKNAMGVQPEHYRHLQQVIQDQFPVETSSFKLCKHIILECIVAQLNMILWWPHFMPTGVMYKVVVEALDRIGWGHTNNMSSGLHSALMSEYKILWRAAIIIQRKWRECISNPNFLMCKKRLLSEFNTLTQNIIVPTNP